MENQKLNELFSNLYYSLDSPASYGSIEKLFEEVRKTREDVKKSDVIKWLQSQLSYTLHKPVKLNFKTRRVVVYDIDKQWQMDLVDLSKISKHNKGNRYIFVAIDILIKYAWMETLKN